MNTKKIEQKIMQSERALFQEKDIFISKSIFEKGESPLKECRNIEVTGSSFKWKY